MLATFDRITRRASVVRLAASFLLTTSALNTGGDRVFSQETAIQDARQWTWAETVVVPNSNCAERGARRMGPHRSIIRQMRVEAQRLSQRGQLLAAEQLARRADRLLKEAGTPAIAEWDSSSADSALESTAFRRISRSREGTDAHNSIVDGDPKIESLAVALQSHDETVALKAVLDLDDFNPRSAAVSELAKALDSGPASVRIVAVATLARLGDDARPATRALVRRLGDPDRGVCEAAAEALRAIGADARPLIALESREGNPVACKLALRLLSELDDWDTGPSVPVLVCGLCENDWRRIATEDAKGVAALSADKIAGMLTQDGDASMRYELLVALGRRGTGERSSVDSAAAALSDPAAPRGVRIAAAWALGQMGSNTLSAKSALLKAMSGNETVSVRAHAAQSLGRIGADSPYVVRSLIAGLSAKEPLLRQACAIALWRFGDKAAAAVPDLVRIASRPDAEAFELYAAICALGAVGSPSAIPAAPRLIQLLAHQDAEVRTAAAFTLGRMPIELDDVTAALCAALSDREPRVVDAAARALLKLGGCAPPNASQSHLNGFTSRPLP
jgi:HEAT repeat protein